MSEEFDKFMFEGIAGLKEGLESSGVKNIRAEAKKIKDNFPDSALFDFLSANDISDKVVNAKDETNDSTLLLQSPEGKITLQNYAMVLGGARAQAKFRSKLITRYRKFRDLSSTMQLSMLNYTYQKIDINEMGSRETGKITDTTFDEELLSILDLFKYTKDNSSVGAKALTSPVKNFDKEIMFDSSIISRTKKVEAVKILMGQNIQIKNILAPFIERLESDLGDANEQTIIVEKITGSGVLGKYDLKLLKRRDEIYDFWADIGTTKWDEFKATHVTFITALKKLDFDSGTGFGKELQELIDYDLDTLQYVMQYRPLPSDVDSPLVNSIKLFNTFIEDNKDNSNVVYDEGTGYRTRSDVAGGGSQVGETEFRQMDAEDIGFEKTLSELVEDINEGLQVDIDPLLYYAYEQGAVGLRGRPLLESQLKKIKLRLKNTLVVIDAEGLEGQLNKLLEQVEGMRVSERKFYYLPYQTEIAEVIPVGSTENQSSNPAKNVESTKKFLKLLSQFIDVGNDFDRGAMGGSSNKYSFPAREGGRGGSRMKDFAKLQMEKKFTDYLSSVMEYFVIPARSRYRPVKTALPHIVARDISIIGKQTPAGQNAFIHLLRMEFTTDEGLLLNKTQLAQVINFMNTLTRPAVANRLRAFIGEVRSFAIAISNIYDNTVTNEVNIEMGAFLHEVLEKNDIEPQMFGIRNEKMTNEWHEDFQQSKSRVLPFEGIYDHIRFRESTYRAAGFASEIKTLIRLESKLDITKSKEEATILQAYDEIRKMLGKPIYYGLSKIDDYDNVADSLDLMKSMFSVDLTAIELENIVNDFDSMQNLSTRHGISVEGVYFLKANFR